MHSGCIGFFPFKFCWGEGAGEDFFFPFSQWECPKHALKVPFFSSFYFGGGGWDDKGTRIKVSIV